MSINYNNPEYITYNTQKTQLKSIILSTEQITSLAISRGNDEYPFTVDDPIFDIPALTTKLTDIHKQIQIIRDKQLGLTGGRRPKRRTRKHAKKQRSRRRRRYTRK